MRNPYFFLAAFWAVLQPDTRLAVRSRNQANPTFLRYDRNLLDPLLIPTTKNNCWGTQLGPHSLFAGVSGEVTGSSALPYKSKPNGKTVCPFLQNKNSNYCFLSHFGAYLIPAWSETENTVVFQTGCWAVSCSLLIGFTNQSGSMLASIGHDSPSGSTIFHQHSPFGASNSFCFPES